MSFCFHKNVLAYFVYNFFCDAVSTFLVQQCLLTSGVFWGTIYYSFPI